MHNSINTAEMDSYKRSLNVNFEKNEIIDIFKRDYKKRKDFYLDDINFFNLMIRRFQLNFNSFEFVDNFSDALAQTIKNDKNNQVLLSQILKYLTENNPTSEINFLKLLINLVESVENNEVKKELFYSIGYSLEKISELESDQLNQLRFILTTSNNEIEYEAKSFLFKIIEKFQTFNDTNLLNYNSKISNFKKKNLIISKTIQTIKTKNKNITKSEKKHVNIAKLSDALQDRTIKQKINIIKNKTPYIINDPGGNDTSILRTDWNEIIRFYRRTMQGEIVKKKDKDEYLANKLFGPINIHLDFTSKIPILDGSNYKIKNFYKFLINRMIVAIFKKVSTSQLLNDLAITKLMKCIVSFSEICQLLSFNEDNIIDHFVESFRFLHVDVTESTSIMQLEIFKNFFEQLKSETLILKYFKRADIKRDFNRSKVYSLIEKEINQLRIDSVETLYNCVLVDKQIIDKSRFEKMKIYLEDNLLRDNIIKIIGLVAETDLISYTEIFKMYFKELIDKRSSQKEAINYILDQSKDSTRCVDLFDDTIINNLLNMIKDTTRDLFIREYLLEIILNCTERDKTRNLSEKQLNDLTNLTFDQNNSSFKNSVVLIILNTVQNFKNLPTSIIEKLAENINSNLDENQSNLVLICLNHIFNESKYLDKAIYLENISFKLADSKVVVEKDGKILFENSSEENSAYTSVSYLAVNILEYSVKKKVSVSDKIVSNIVKSGLDNEDKQTRIKSAYCLYELSKYHLIENHALIEIKDYLNDNLIDVSVYCQVAYIIGLHRISQTNNKSIAINIHLDFLPELFVLESLLKIDDQDFTDLVNNNILEIFLMNVNQISLNQKNIFSLLEIILNNDLIETFSKQVIKILVDYTSTGKHLPESCIVSLENSLNLFEDSLQCLKNVIRNGQPVNNNILKLISDQFFLPFSAQDYLDMFKLLEKSRFNQDISKYVFNIIELVKAGYGLDVEDQSYKTSILNFLLEQTNKGNYLPINTLNSLSILIKTSETIVLKIILNLTINKQMIDSILIYKLDELFDVKKCNIDLLTIFENLARNNQVLTPSILKKLENTLDNKLASKSTLSIFVYLAQKGENLSNQIINRILDELLDKKTVNQDYLSSISSIILTYSKLDLCQLNKIEIILINGINSKIVNIQLMCIKSMILFIEKFEINDETCNKIVDIGTNIMIDDERIKNEFYTLFQLKRFNQTYLRNKIGLAYLKYDTNDKLLNQLDYYVTKTDLLDKNYDQLRTIIETDYDKHFKALNILEQIKNKKRINNELIESIAVVFESTTSEEIKEKALSILKCIENIPTTSKAFKILNQKDSKLKNYLKISELNTSKDDLNDLIEYIHNNLDCYFDNETAVSLVERLMSSTSIETDILLKYYLRIIFEKKYQNIYALDNVKLTASNEKLYCECVSSLFEFENLSQSCFDFLENKLIDYKNDKKLKYLSFKG
jgi:hypothetical protein